MNLSRTHASSRLAVIAVAPLLATAAAHPAAGATAVLPTVEIVGNAIVFTAAPGVDDDVIIGGTEDGTLDFFGVTGSSYTSETCTSDGCDVTGIDKVVVYLLDGDDAVYADIPWHVPALRFVIHGGPGNDSIGGNAGYSDRLYGGGGDDSIRGYTGGDFIRGGAGDDTLRGMGGIDVVRGGPGSDELRGGRGNDYLFGGDAADEVHGGSGQDILEGEKGPDTLFSDDGVKDEVYGGPGTDTADVDRLDAVFGVEQAS